MSDPRPPYRPPLGKDLREALGALTIEYASLDMELKFLVWRLLKPDVQKVGKIVTANLTGAALLTLLSTLWKLRTGHTETGLRRRMKVFSKRVEKAEKKRNQFTHSYWVPRSKTDDALVIGMRTKRGGFEEQGENVNALDVLGLAREFKDLREELLDLVPAIDARCPAPNS